MNRRLRTLSASAALLAATAGGLALSPTAGASTERDASRDELAAVRAATAKYHRVDAAIAAGYQRSEECVASPDGSWDTTTSTRP